MRPWVLLLLVATVAGEEKLLDKRLATVDRGYVRRLFDLARKADRKECDLFAAAVYDRLLAVDPDHTQARKKRFFTKVNGKWDRDALGEAKAKALFNAEPLLVGKFRGELAKYIQWRVEETVRVCEQHATPAARRRVLESLLNEAPDNTTLHRALGHMRVRGVWVHPAIVETANRMRRRLQEWRACNMDLPGAAPDDAGERLPAVGTLPVYYVGRRAVGSDIGRLTTSSLASSTEAPHRLLRHLLGVEAKHYDPKFVVFLGPGNYGRLVRAVVKDPNDLRVALRYVTFDDHPDFLAFRAADADTARDFYAHRVGFFTMRLVAAPLRVKGGKKRDHRANAWLKEGLGYLLSFELYNSGELHTASPWESTRKIKYTRDPPETLTRRACLAWLREQVRAGYAVPFPELFGKSLNNLHILASLQAYSFLRFLFLHDPQGAALFPRYLAEQESGSPAVRTDRALRSAFGKDTLELARLWRSFLEIDRGD